MGMIFQIRSGGDVFFT
ncbi:MULTISPECIES: hypothetical protein [unclassified Ruminococcus]